MIYLLMCQNEFYIAEEHIISVKCSCVKQLSPSSADGDISQVTIQIYCKFEQKSNKRRVRVDKAQEVHG